MTMPSNIHPVILSGGSGTRLWPLSRKSYAKQFARLLSTESLFQKTVKRVGEEGFAKPVIITGDKARFIVIEQLAAIGKQAEAILIEPDGRDTAPAILAATLWINDIDPDGLVLVAPSDHAVPDDLAFQETIRAAAPQAEKGDIVVIGVEPTRPETGYGYLALQETAHARVKEPRPLKGFVEKPDIDHAISMVESGSFLWNTGIFIASVKTLLSAFGSHSPDLVDPITRSVKGALLDLGFVRLDPDPWQAVKPISIDYAIMEKADNLSVIPYDQGWSDLGGWEAVWLESGPDDQGVVCSPHATAISCTNSLLRTEDEDQELVGIGLNNIIAVATSDAVLVAHRSQVQRVKEAVKILKEQKIKQAEQFPRDHRPWGWYESLASGNRFQVKRIVVKPGEALSLQSHHHRAEHWIVVAGTAKVTIDANIHLVTENQSIYIPLGAIHRLENPGKVPMVLIEVQTGAYLGEDDITRYDDRYARS